MKVGKIVFAFLIFFGCKSGSKPTDDRQEVRKIMDSMSELIMKQDYEAVYEMSYPGSYGSNSKEEVLQDLKNSMHDQGYSLEIKNIHVDSISEVYNYNSNKYAVVNFTTDGVFQFAPLPNEDVFTMTERFNKFCNNGMNQINDEKYFSCNHKDKSVFYKQKDFSFFIYKNQDKKWYVLTTGSFQKIPSAIPDEILKKLKK